MMRRNLWVMALLALTLRAFGQTTGIYRELWPNLNSSVGNTLSMLTNTDLNPNWPDHPDPSFTKIFDTFETEVNTGMNFYGQRLRSYIVAPATGQYTFWISSDDSSSLFLSTDENPANKQAVAWVNTWTSSREWTKEPNQQSAPVTLTGGQRYYIEAIMQQGSGGDNLAAQWQLPDGTIESPIPGSRMLLDSTPKIVAQPTNTTVTELTSASFTVGLANFVPPSIQWLRGSTNIPGATNVTLVLPVATLADNGSVFHCVVSNQFGVMVSSNATLAVIPDTTAPLLASAYNTGLTNILVVYSKPMEASSAANIGNYSISPSTSISGAQLVNSSTVSLAVGQLALGTNYTITVNGVRDQATTPNAIAPNSQITFQASDFIPAAIGNPPLPVSYASYPQGLDLSGSGSDIGAMADQFQFNYQQVSGNFDIQVQLKSLTDPNPFAKAGLMARVALTTNSPFAAVFGTPTIDGCFFESRGLAGDSAVSAGSLPVNYPNTWLRLKRSGNTLTGYAGFDGSTWVQLGTVSITANSLYVGLAVSSHNPSAAATAQFRNYGATTSAAVGKISLPYEQLGPCSRRTQLVLSEIMYKPAPRADGRNLEYIEIFNSNPWYEDISGFQIAGSIQYTFPTNSILPGGGFIVVAASPADVQSVYGIANVVGPYAHSLKKTGEIQLVNELGGILLDVSYDNVLPWPAGALGTGHSIVMEHPSYGEADPRAWSVSESVGGSPGGPESYRASPLRNVAINEISAHPKSALSGYVEIYNHSTASADISGCLLADETGTNVYAMPTNTVVGAAGFAAFRESQLGFSLNPAGGRLLLWNADQSRVLDAVTYEPMGLNASIGRWPDGAADFYPLAGRSPGASNGPVRIGDIVINELMYKPISGNDDDQYVELYNKGANAVDIGGWQFVAGIDYQFQPNTVIGPGQYLVVARNQTRLISRYPNLNATNTVGDFSGKLPHKGGRVALARTNSIVTTNSLGQTLVVQTYEVEDEVNYKVGGRWGQWAHGGGSSLELIDPNSNHRLAYNWTDSDESSKSSWTNLTVTGRLDNGANYGSSIDLIQAGLLDVGECLLDNFEVRSGTTGQNLVANSDLENGLTGWTPQGDHIRSSLEPVDGLGGFQSNQSLHLRATDGVWTGYNSVQGTLNANSLGNGQTATMRVEGRWLHGSPEVLVRLHGNWLELTGSLPIPSDLGTPGLPNSRAIAKAGPAIYEVTHSPSIPQANQGVVVTARFHDVAGIQPTVAYRVDTAINANPTYISVNMRDDGLGADDIAEDGIYSAAIAPQPAGTTVAFLVRASDTAGGSSIFPQPRLDNTGLPRECVIVYGDTIPTGTFGHYHVWITQNWADRWNRLGGLSNDGNDFTFVDGGGRIIYGAEGHYAGSPYHQYTGSPLYTVGGMHWTLPDDDLMLGTASFNKQHVPGNGPLDDNTLQREQASFWMARQLGVPWLYRRYYVLYVNGNRHGPLMEDTQVPNGDYLSEYFPADSGGFLYKNHSWFEFEPNIESGGNMSFNNNSWCELNKITTLVPGSGTQLKLARYRWMFWIRQSPDSNNNFTNVFALVNAMNISTASSVYYTNLEAMVDTEEFMRVSALEHASGDWDSFTTQNQWNMFSYKPVNGKWTLLKWDWNITLGNSGSWGPDGSQLFTVDGADPVMNAFQSYAPYRRAMLRAFKDLINGPMNNTNIDPVLDAKFSAFAANGLDANFGVASPDGSGLKSWIHTMRQSLTSALSSQGTANVPFTVNGSASYTTGASVAVVTGSAPVEVRTITVNGESFPLVWNTIKTWTLKIPLNIVTNVLALQGTDGRGRPIATASSTLTIINTNAVQTSLGPIAINEWMAANTVTLLDPADGKAEDWFELYNSNAVPVDISGYLLSNTTNNPTQWNVPAGTSVPAQGYLLVWADKALASANDAPNHYLHANFKLAKSGASILVYDRQTNLVDGVTFGPQSQDISQGRYPNGGPLIYSLRLPTPGASNVYTNQAPTLALIPNQVVSAGGTVSFTASASDPDAPPQELTYSLDPGAPAGAAIDADSGAFHWVAPSVQTSVTNTVTVRVTDDGLPPLSDAKSFLIIDNPAQSAPIVITTISSASNHISLSWTSEAGQTYRLQYKDRLNATNWIEIPANIPSAGAATTSTDALNATNTARFFRVVGIQ